MAAMHHRRRPLTPLLLLCTAAGLGAQSARVAGPSDLAYRETDSPAGNASQTPNLHAGPDGSVHLTWLEGLDSGTHRLRWATHDGTRWGAARTVVESAEDAPWFVNWADFPSLVATPDGALAAHFLARHPGSKGTYAYDVQVTWSVDGGERWSAPRPPHTDDTASEHGFVSLVPMGPGQVQAVWLDGRATGGAHAGSMTLRTARLDPEGGRSEEALLDERVCDCCQTAAVRTSEGLLVAYRDRSDEELRDISIVRLGAEGWSAPEPLHRDGWTIAGCPVDGPALDARGSLVVAAWTTGADDQTRVRVAWSEDAGAHFGLPVEVDDGDPIGRADIVLLEEGGALVSWVERVEDGAEIRVRRVGADGRAAEISRTLTRTWPTRSSGFPRLALAGGRVHLAWTDATSPMRVRTAEITP